VIYSECLAIIRTCTTATAAAAATTTTTKTTTTPPPPPPPPPTTTTDFTDIYISNILSSQILCRYNELLVFPVGNEISCLNSQYSDIYVFLFLISRNNF
jgi:hypothetical protein